MTGKIVGFFIIVIVVIGIFVAIYNSGILGRAGELLNSIGTSSSTPGSVYTPLPYVPPSQPGTGGTAGSPGGTTIGPPATPTPIPSYEIPPGMTAAQLSPYFHEVRFGGLSAGSAYSYGQITLYAYPNNASSSIDVTGWQIKANHGGEYIPQAVSLYDPSGLTPESDIFLKNGDVLYLYSSSAPVNLRLNECIGYLPNKTQFTPQLPQSCPPLDLSAISSFSGACQNYIETLGSCTEPNLSSPYVPQNDYACVSYLENNFNYSSCYDNHVADSNFLSNQIWAFMGSSPIDQFHDQVELLDRNGLVVDTYSY
ncbi:MAG TPA: hypothetical protein VHZ04_01100 [Candidatus Paceibacterota bacterium]|jgi:hypothetical protein|nr:hypothetical protein [Candidatus Paceibacterota bacterium]